MQALGAGTFQSLVDSLQGFTSAEILLALFIAAALQKSDDKSDSSGAALGFLAGLAMAGQVGQSATINIQGQLGGAEAGMGNGVGLTFNVLA